jgi:hypothetical protein
MKPAALSQWTTEFGERALDRGICLLREVKEWRGRPRRRDRVSA